MTLEELKEVNKNFKLDRKGNIIFDLRMETIFYPDLLYMYYIIQKRNLVFYISSKGILIHER